MISELSKQHSSDLSQKLADVFIDIRKEIFSLIKKAPHNLVESVHLIRKRLKFLRAYVKLTQFCSEGDDYGKMNLVLRDCGRLISDCRNVHVRGVLLDELRQKTESSYLSLIEDFIVVNKQETNRVENDLIENSIFENLGADLSKSDLTKYFFSLEPDKEWLLSGYELCYQKSYEAFHSELTSLKADLLHEWRKRTKDLQYQQEILARTIPGDLPPSFTEIAELCEILGKINDLYMLLDWMNTLQGARSFQSSSFLDDVILEIKSLQKQANERGHALYPFTPADYSKRLAKTVKQ